MRPTSLEDNIRVHNKIAKRYESIHGEIYNSVEQDRLKRSLKSAISYVSTGSAKPVALDFGCGAGNLTAHLTELGCDVIAGDVSSGFLDLVASRTYRNTVTTFKLNGIDLEGLPDESVDMVAMYSVLHHVPDYLSLMKEFSRVLKPGGVVYIDHEASASSWTDPLHQHFKKHIKKNSKKDFRKYFIVTNYIDRFIRVFINPKYQREGDIHVFADDRIEWQVVRQELEENGMEILKEEDYLLYRRNYDQKTYEEWAGKVADMHLLMGRKL
jgi:ubiquinone/menaquinone biosynthesis C-methylase UbiE